MKALTLNSMPLNSMRKTKTEFEHNGQIKESQNGFMPEFNQAQSFNLNCEGYVVVKADTQKEQAQITELMQTIIISENDQQAKLFYN